MAVENGMWGFHLNIKMVALHADPLVVNQLRSVWQAGVTKDWSFTTSHPVSDESQETVSQVFNDTISEAALNQAILDLHKQTEFKHLNNTDINLAREKGNWWKSLPEPSNSSLHSEAEYSLSSEVKEVIADLHADVPPELIFSSLETREQLLNRLVKIRHVLGSSEKTEVDLNEAFRISTPSQPTLTPDQQTSTPGQQTSTPSQQTLTPSQFLDEFFNLLPPAASKVSAPSKPSTGDAPASSKSQKGNAPTAPASVAAPTKPVSVNPVPEEVDTYRSIASEEMHILQQALNVVNLKAVEAMVLKKSAPSEEMLTLQQALNTVDLKAEPPKPKDLGIIAAEVAKEKFFNPTAEDLAVLNRAQWLIPESNQTVETEHSIFNMLDPDRSATVKFEPTCAFAQKHGFKRAYSLLDHYERVEETRRTIKRFSTKQLSPLVQCATLAKFGIGEAGEVTADSCFKGARYFSVGFFGMRTTPGTENSCNATHAFAVFIASDLEAEKFFKGNRHYSYEEFLSELAPDVNLSEAEKFKEFLSQLPADDSLPEGEGFFKGNRYFTFEAFLSKLPPNAILFDAYLRLAFFPFELMQKGKRLLDHMCKFKLDQVVHLDTLMEDSGEIFYKEEEVNSLLEKTAEQLGKSSTFEVSYFWQNYMESAEAEFHSLWNGALGAKWNAIRIRNATSSLIVMRIVLKNELTVIALILSLKKHEISNTLYQDNASQWRIDIPESSVTLISKIRADAKALHLLLGKEAEKVKRKTNKVSLKVENADMLYLNFCKEHDKKEEKSQKD